MCATWATSIEWVRRVEIIPFVFHEHLGFVFQTTKGRGMDDPISIPMKGRAMGAFLSGNKRPFVPAGSAAKIACICAAFLVLMLFCAYISPM